MRLKFENWYQQKVNNADAKELFNEGCICYKVGAYRAAFLMSYLGFQTILRERMLRTRVLAEKFPESKWEEVQNKLRDDKTWDDEVTDMVNRLKPVNPFLINDDLRKQYQYFRCIRNDCAHAKSNIISYSHVESLWLFIESNYNKFVVNGGRSGLLERIDKHYDPNYTKPGSDVSSIVEDIGTSMNIEEIPLFLKDVYNLLEKKSYGKLFSSNEFGDFWRNIIFSENEEIRKSVIEFIKEDWNIFLEFINEYPEKLNEVLSNCDSSFKREFWKKKIYNLSRFKYTNRWLILENIIKNKIIPDDELGEFIEKLSQEIKKVPPKEQLEYFKRLGYLEELKKKHFGSGTKFRAPAGIDYANNNWECIKDLIINIELDYEVVRQLNMAFLRSSYGVYHDGMEQLLKDNKEFRNKYKEILDKNHDEIPKIIEEIENEEVK